MGTNSSFPGGRDDQLSKNPSSLNLLKSDLEEAFRSTPPARLLSNLEDKMWTKSVCMTSKHHDAIIAGEVRLRDLVFVVRGVTQPLVLRPAAADSTYDEFKTSHNISTFYELVGGAYIHGMMDGEVLEMAKNPASGISEETIYLI